MAAYAPLLINANPGGMQWSSDLIGYDALSSYGSPSYHAQVLFLPRRSYGEHRRRGRRRQILLLGHCFSGQGLREASHSMDSVPPAVQRTFRR